MLFNSLGFLLFLPVVFLLHWFFVKHSKKGQNGLLFAASYFFYGCWDYRFLFLLIFSTLLDYFLALRMVTTVGLKKRRLLLWVSIVINLGFLAVFKYYNFFVTSFSDGLSAMGLTVSFTTLNVILPVGISFYTFHGLSYIIDVYNKRINPEKDIVDYSLFVAFFPLLVAGPIERATHLLPQFKQKRQFKYAQAVDGLKQMLWGFFKKLVIADNCADYVNRVFENPAAYSGSSHALATLLFSIQIYADFSGYSDIALGTARLFGIELLQNFSFPYFSRNIAEFWRRWHISLTTWFRDYVYIPLGGSRAGHFKTIRNIFIVFLLSAFWHGANWTFIAWGLLHALYFIPVLLLKRNRLHLDIVATNKLIPSPNDIARILLTFLMVSFAWIFFRAESISHAIQFIEPIFSADLFTTPYSPPLLLTVHLCLFGVIEWIGREKRYATEDITMFRYRLFRWSVYALLIFYIGMYMATNETPFIYFQF